jgi:peptidase E
MKHLCFKYTYVFTLITAVKHAVYSFEVNRNNTIDIKIKLYHLSDPVMVAGGNTMERITIIHKKEDLQIITNRSYVYQGITPVIDQ